MKVYMVDDNDVSLFLTKNLLLLKDGSLDIRCFLSATEALETMISEELPDILLLDLNMPLMNGWEFLPALSPNEASIRSRSRIYILTSSLDKLDWEEADRTPLVSGFLPKPLESQNIDCILSVKP